jgi:GT2 family glycosyltransferase
MARIYILLPVHNRKDVTLEFVRCLSAQSFADYKLVLIDDGSTDGTAAMVKQILPLTTVIEGNGSWWWAGCLQRGLDWLQENSVSDDSLVLFMNDDVSFGPDFLERALEVMRTRRGSLVLAKTHVPPNGDVSETGVVADLRRLSFRISESAQRINCLPTRGLFAYWSDVRKIGGFHPRLLPHYLSDYEYTIRAHKKGLRCESSSELLIVSNEETTGFHAIEERSFISFLKKYFSKKASGNPIYWSTFVFLTISPVWILPNLARVWRGAAKDIVRAMLHRGTNTPEGQISPKAG